MDKNFYIREEKDMDNAFVGRHSITESKIEYKEDHFFYVTVIITHKRSKDLVEWEEKKFEVTVYDRSLNKAIEMASDSAEKTMKDCNYNLFNLKE